MRLTICQQEAAEAVAIAPKQVWKVSRQASILLNLSALSRGRETQNPVNAIIGAIVNRAGNDYLMVCHSHAGIMRHDKTVSAAMNIIHEAVECLPTKTGNNQRDANRHWLKVSISPLPWQPALNVNAPDIAAACL